MLQWINRFYTPSLISLALLYTVLMTVRDSTGGERLAAFSLAGFYIVMLWSSVWVKSLWKNVVIFACLYAATLAFWLISGEVSTVLALMGFLMGFISLKLPGLLSTVSAGLIAVIIFAITYVVEKQSLSNATEMMLIFAGIYVLLYMRRLKRIHDEEQQLHHDELQAVNARLLEANRKLQAAQSELEHAAMQSMRYAVMEERNRIARDIHDSVGHQLTSVIVQLQALPYALQSNKEETMQIARNVLLVAKQCLQEVRGVVHARGGDQAGTGLIALRALVRQASAASGIPIEWKAPDGGEEWPAEQSAVLYYCLQEALTNMIRHSEASKAVVAVEQLDGEVRMVVRDNGLFAGGDGWAEGFGLNGMKQRCREAGGSCRVTAVHPHGMEIAIQLPLETEKER
ncbi:sensor histidine kinase [Paenibacillus protaetiae]|uniref:sensor histidine kinase n=1 Tax=Paenibacillus protaetiae TaxID=2509456 RepID=UPI0013ED0BDE|nr:sensor histidine kinase [Paenibacillus protaetiae]